MVNYYILINKTILHYIPITLHCDVHFSSETIKSSVTAMPLFSELHSRYKVGRKHAHFIASQSWRKDCTVCTVQTAQTKLVVWTLDWSNVQSIWSGLCVLQLVKDFTVDLICTKFKALFRPRLHSWAMQNRWCLPEEKHHWTEVCTVHNEQVCVN